MRARTRLSARSSRPGSSKSAKSSSAATMRYASSAARRDPRGSLRKPLQERKMAARSPQAASASAQDGSVESEVSRQAL